MNNDLGNHLLEKWHMEVREHAICRLPLSPEIRRFLLDHRHDVTIGVLLQSLFIIAGRLDYRDDPVAVETVANCLRLCGFENDAETWLLLFAPSIPKFVKTDDD